MSTVVPAEDLRGDDEEDTRLLRAMVGEARSYIEHLGWWRAIERVHFGFAAGGIVAVFLVTTPIFGVLMSLPSRTAQELASLASPMMLISGLGTWLFKIGGTGLPVGRFGPVYAIEAVTLIAACLLLLLARYRKVASL